jgi:hypothetical protein
MYVRSDVAEPPVGNPEEKRGGYQDGRRALQINSRWRER